jgi:hypothetical protein
MSYLSFSAIPSLISCWVFWTAFSGLMAWTYFYVWPSLCITCFHSIGIWENGETFCWRLYRYVLRVFGKWAWGGSSTLYGLTIWFRPHVVSTELAQSDLLSHWGLLGLTFWAAESRKRGRFFLHKVMQPWSPECLESQHPTYASSKKLLNYAPNCLCANCAKSQRYLTHTDLRLHPWIIKSMKMTFKPEP